MPRVDCVLFGSMRSPARSMAEPPLVHAHTHWDSHFFPV